MKQKTLLLTAAIALFHSVGFSSITVVGIGEVEVAPDIAFVNVYVVKQGYDYEEIMSSVGAIERKIKKDLEGIPYVKGSRMVDESISEIDRYTFESDKSLPKVYSVARHWQIMVSPERENVAGLLKYCTQNDIEVKEPGNTFFGADGMIVYGISDSKMALKEALEDSFHDARDKADKISKIIGVKVTGVTAVECLDGVSGCGFSYNKDYPVLHTGKSPEKIIIRTVKRFSFSTD